MERIVSSVATLDKAMAVLDTLGEQPSTLAELVVATGLPRATAHRLAVALELHGLVRRDAAGRFALGMRTLALARAAAESLLLVDVARPVLRELRDRTGESAQLYVRDRDRRVCVVSLESPHGLRTIVPTGASLPLELGSAGHVLSGRADVAERGWAESVAEREAGVASVSAPVTDGEGSVVAAISVSGPIERTTRTPGERYAEAVTGAARRLERAAGLRV